MKKFKSYGFWTALAGAVAILATNIGRYFGLEIDGSLAADIVMGIAGVLVVFGVVCMPKNEDKKEISKENLPEEKPEIPDSPNESEDSLKNSIKNIENLEISKESTENIENLAEKLEKNEEIK